MRIQRSAVTRHKVASYVAPSLLVQPLISRAPRRPARVNVAGLEDFKLQGYPATKKSTAKRTPTTKKKVSRKKVAKGGTKKGSAGKKATKAAKKATKAAKKATKAAKKVGERVMPMRGCKRRAPSLPLPPAKKVNNSEQKKNNGAVTEGDIQKAQVAELQHQIQDLQQQFMAQQVRATGQAALVPPGSSGGDEGWQSSLASFAPGPEAFAAGLILREQEIQRTRQEFEWLVLNQLLGSSRSNSRK